MSHHTPGPWEVLEGKPGFGVNRAHLRVIVRQPDSFVPLYVADCIREGSLDETRANARLIAAAPELLAALRNLLADATALGIDDSPFSGVAIEARNAIAKATGVKK